MGWICSECSTWNEEENTTCIVCDKARSLADIKRAKREKIFGAIGNFFNLVTNKCNTVFTIALVACAAAFLITVAISLINRSFLPAIDRYFILLGQKIQAHFSTGALGALFKNIGQGFANLFSNLGSLFNLSITYNFRVFFVNLANYFVHMYSVIIGSAFFGEFFVRLFAKTADFFLNLVNYFKHLFNRFA
ncbi:MAG: hypothetical protein IJW13_04775 [Clostridia bacterium]|nr:hypothetical protein [Clostridia bacterium]